MAAWSRGPRSPRLGVLVRGQQSSPAARSRQLLTPAPWEQITGLSTEHTSQQVFISLIFLYCGRGGGGIINAQQKTLLAALEGPSPLRPCLFCLLFAGPWDAGTAACRHMPWALTQL